MKLRHKVEWRNASKQYKRRYTLLDMACIKHDAAIQKARLKRREITLKPKQDIVICGCGLEGCFIHTGFAQIVT